MRQHAASINMGWLSEYRTEIMGVSAIGIILCHANLAHVAVPSIVKTVLGMGNFCVDVFLFLSGLGICFSLNKDQNYKLGQWYKKRFIRILIPYLVIYTPYYIWRCAANHYPIWKFFYYISTLGYWVEHDGAWFVALLIPLYLLSPFLYRLINKTNGKVRYVIDGVAIVAIYVISAQTFKTGSQIADQTIYNVQFALCRVPCYIIGFLAWGG